ncbi:MAG: hypothetical protein KDJ29_10000 [Hyphomicrobiales bacterium]|nr:hypothetical protein [Hyphomicrobiales bacterium]
MFDKSDPRSRLAKDPGAPAQSDAFAAAEYVRFYESDPQETGDGFRTWYARGQNFIVALTESEPGARLARRDQPDEYVVLLEHPGTAVRINANGDTLDVPGYSLAIIPPGDSEVIVPEGGRIVRLFTTQSEDLAARCSNASAYIAHHPFIPPFEAWPEPVGGYRIRAYSLDVPEQPGRFGKIWRCTTFMVNVFDPFIGPRDTTLLSPHHHDDFEQCSLALAGNFMHHIRWPWTRNMAAWRDDEHVHCGSPSVCVIPPPSIHTSRWLDDGRHQLVDIFSPPRMDFSQQEGWVLNAEDYPMPAQAKSE